MPNANEVPNARAGFTITELLVAAVLTATVFAVALPFLNGQSRTVTASAGRLDAAQNARFAQNTIDRELRMVGVNTLGMQPMLVQADRFAVTFNADLATTDIQDYWSIYYDPDADSTTTLAMQPPALRLPVTGFRYPTIAMLDKDGLPGRAETISYWVSPDSTSPRPNEFVLFRSVNRATPQVVTTGLYVAPGQPFFTYLWAKDSTGVIDTVPAAKLPLLHVVAQHGSLADTGETASLAAQVDRVRTVIVTATGQYQDAQPNAPLVRRTATARTTLINMTMLNRPSCGLAPVAVSSLNATLVMVPIIGQPDHIHLAWSHAQDDGGGERDVERYLIYRSVNGAPYGDPLDEVPSSNGGNYTYEDPDVKRSGNPGAFNTFAYAVVAQDCQPQVSAPTSSATLNVPVIP